MDFTQSYAKLMAQTGNALAPTILQDARESLDRVEKLFGKHVEKRWVRGFTDRLTLGFTEEELKKHIGDPAFLIAIGKLMQECLARFNKGE